MEHQEIDPSNQVYKSFQMFIEAGKQHFTTHMSAGVNWQDASPSVINALQWELEVGLTYKNYGRSVGAKIITDVISKVEYELANADKNIESIIVNGATDGAYLICSYLKDNNIINEDKKALMVGYAFPIYSSIFKKLNVDYIEVIEEKKIVPSIDVVMASIIKYKPALIILPLPHNPSGILKSEEYYQKIFDCARITGTKIIIDRVCMMPWDFNQALATAIYEEVVLGNAFVVDALSKSNSLAGIRIGYILTGNQYLQKLENEIRYRNLNPAVFATPTLAMCRVGDLALTKGIHLTKKYVRLIIKYEKSLWMEYPNDYRPPNVAGFVENFVCNYVSEQKKLEVRIKDNFKNIKAIFAGITTTPLILDAGFNVLLQLDNMYIANEIDDQLELANKYGACVLTKNCFTAEQCHDEKYFIRLSLTIPVEEFKQGLKNIYNYYQTSTLCNEIKVYNIN